MLWCRYVAPRGVHILIFGIWEHIRFAWQVTADIIKRDDLKEGGDSGIRGVISM